MCLPHEEASKTIRADLQLSFTQSLVSDTCGCLLLWLSKEVVRVNSWFGCIHMTAGAVASSIILNGISCLHHLARPWYCIPLDAGAVPGRVGDASTAAVRARPHR